MKTKITNLLFVLIGFFSSLNSGNAQSWLLAGNTLTGTLPTSPNEWIGTINDADWKVKTANNERMRILSTGNVGIGITTPVEKLSVAGNLFLTGTHGEIYSSDRNHLIVLRGDQAGSFGNMNCFYEWGGLLSASEGHRFFTGGIVTAQIERMRISDDGIYMSGILGIGTSTPLAKLHVYNGSLLVDGTTGITPTSGAGTRMMWIPAKSAFRAGVAAGTTWNDVNIGMNSVAMGNSPKASGVSSVALGTATIASGDGSMACGGYSTASGIFSYANGFLSTASGDNSVAFGYTSIAQSYGSFIVGQYNVVTGGTGNSWVLTEPLFVVGNGTSSGGGESNAVTVLKNGNVGIGTIAPVAKLEVTGQIKITGGSPGVGKVLTSDASGLASWGATSVGWLTTGNAGTSASTNFIGTTDNIAVVFKANNTKAGIINPTGATFFGYQAGNSNTSTSSIGFGYQALSVNTTGASNAAFGQNTLNASVTANRNTAIGNWALNSASTSDNTGLGFEAAVYSTSGARNTAIGSLTLRTNTTGSNNTTIGYSSDVASAALTNATAIGNLAIVNTSDKVRIGASTVLVVEGPVAYTFSDGRFKDNVTEDVKGLDFINRLRPVVYNLNTKKVEEFLTKNMSEENRKKHFEDRDFETSTTIRQSGFIAQEVEKAAAEAGYNFNGIHKPENNDDNYSLAYSEFVVPLVKAIQEQQKLIESLQQQINKLTTPATIIKNGNSAINTVELGNKNTIVLEQNAPNPFAEQTTINYFLPENIKYAEIIFFDQTGKIIKKVSLNEKGNGELQVFASDLSNGIYTYSLIVDGQTIETKKMMKAK